MSIVLLTIVYVYIYICIYNHNQAKEPYPEKHLPVMYLHIII